MKHTQPMEFVKVMPSYSPRGNTGTPAAVRESARVQGGNWSTQAFRRSGHVHDEDECQTSIADFMGGQGRFDGIE